MKKPTLILVAGGSASGKSTVVDEIVLKSGLEDVLIIKQDDYYLPHKELTFEQRERINYDHPSSLDNQLLFQDLSKLLNLMPISKPVYDFVSYTRKEVSETVYPKAVIIVEGILILDSEEIRNLADICIFVELDDDTRFIRRMLRDIKERNRSLESIVKQYEETVKPMFHRFVKPTKRFADVIIPNDRGHDIAVDIIVAKIRQLIGEKV